MCELDNSRHPLKIKVGSSYSIVLFSSIATHFQLCKDYIVQSKKSKMSNKGGNCIIGLYGPVYPFPK